MGRFSAFLIFVCSVSASLALEPPKGLLTAPVVTAREVESSTYSNRLRLETAEDGSTYIAMRLRLHRAPAVRVHISDMHLTEGQRIVISNHDGTRVYGPFEVAGPTQSGQFWSDAVAGSDVIVELQAGHEGAAELPFRIEAIEAAELWEVTEPGIKQSNEIEESWYGGMSVKHSVEDGLAIFEGDILLGPVEELPRSPVRSKNLTRSAVGITGQSYRWPNATLPYVVAANLPSPARVSDAVAHWNSVMAGVVRMVPRTTETVYVSFNRAPSAGTCSSYIGKVWKSAQPIQIGDNCTKGNVIHEIGHAWGLWHEHTREDRDKYVTIQSANIQANQSFNFTQNIANGDDIGQYDFNSIMHYHATAFSVNGLPTIVTIPAGISIGQRNALSTGDIAGIKALYPSGGTTGGATVVTTVSSNPQGSYVLVDGVAHATPASFNWVNGSAHTIAALNASNTAMRTTFAGWSDGGAQSHSVTASAGVNMYRADYAVSYAVKAKAIPGGSAKVQPSSADAFYAAGTTLGLEAAPADGYCFSGWTGLIAGAPAKTTIVAGRAYDLTANFQTGAISLTSTNLAVPVAGGTLTVGVTASTGCLWSAAPNTPWIKVSSTPAASGSGTMSFSVDPNTSGLPRSGTVAIGSANLTITQSGR